MNKELTLDAKKENLDNVLEFLDNSLDELGCPMKAKVKLDICVEELFVNIASYAYPSGTGKAVIRIESGDTSSVTLTFIDSGTPYNPLARQDPNTHASAEERDIGGLGILIVKKSVDEISYRYENGNNILTFRKNL